jgi:hypothetical protein
MIDGKRKTGQSSIDLNIKNRIHKQIVLAHLFSNFEFKNCKIRQYRFGLAITFEMNAITVASPAELIDQGEF